MIADVLSLTRLEWYKLRHRRMPWILLLLSVLLVQITFWGAYAVFRVGADVALGDGGGTASVSGDFLDILAFPNIAVIGLAVSHGFGIILIMILAASLTGTEYGWGTVRTVLTRGAGAGRFWPPSSFSLRSWAPPRWSSEPPPWPSVASSPR